jgi:hypothetical protein
VRLYLIG